MAQTKERRAPIAALALALALSLAAAPPALAYEQRESIVASGHGSLSPSYLVVHETANPGASAANHVSYWSRSPAYAVHYVMELDGSVVYHTMRDDRLAWHVGGGNRMGYGIELAHATDAASFASQFDQAARWCADQLRSRGWGIDRLISHDEARRMWGGTDHTDPNGYFAAYGQSWASFEARVAGYLNGGSGSGSTGGSSAPGSGQQAGHAGTGFGGTYRVAASALNVRTGPGTGYRAVATYRAGQTVALDDWYAVSGGYVWGRYTAYSGAVRYVAVGPATGAPDPADYLVRAGSGSGQQAGGSGYGLGRYTFRAAVRVRTGPGTGYRQVATYSAGQSVTVGSTVVSGGYVWGRYTAYSGAVRYVALGVAGGPSYVR